MNKQIEEKKSLNQIESINVEGNLINNDLEIANYLNNYFSIIEVEMIEKITPLTDYLHNIKIQ